MNLTTACSQLRQYAEERMLEADLSPREIECARLWLRGLSNQEVSSYMGVARKTVNTYCVSIYRKLGTNTRSQFFACLLPVFDETGA